MEAKPIPGTEGYQQIGGRILPVRETPDVKDIRSKLKELEKIQLGGDKGDKNGLAAFEKSKEGKKLQAAEESDLAAYVARQSMIAELRKQLDALSTKATVPRGTKYNLVERANEIARQHPEWSKEQVIKAVRGE